MRVKEIIYEDYVNYRKPSLFIGVCKCDWKCCREDTECKCQNQGFANYPVVEVDDEKLIREYINNPLTHAVVFGGLEPILQWDEILSFIKLFRNQCDDDIVIYTGYFPEEIKQQINDVKQYKNIIIKFGRYHPKGVPHYDDVLGVELSNKEQFALKIS